MPLEDVSCDTGSDSRGHVKVMRLRYAGTCTRCGCALPVGARAGYLRDTRTVQCLTCFKAEPPHSELPALTPAGPSVSPASSGAPGSSARREYERRSAKREARIRETHPRIGGFLLAISEEPRSTTAWARGARGEEMLGGHLNSLGAQGIRVLHDRRIPRSRANIDHLAVGPSGVHVIDAKRYRGRPSLRVEGGILRPRVQKLVVGSRDCTSMVDGMHKQVALVRAALDRSGADDVPVHGALCFVDADWPLIGGSFVISDVAVVWPKKLSERLTAGGALSAARVAATTRILADAFVPA